MHHYVLVTGRQDDELVAVVLRKDSLIAQLGNSKLDKLGVKKAPVVRQQLRQIVRVLIQVRELLKQPTACISDLIEPVNYDVFIEAVQNVCLTSENKSMTGGIQLEKPALALKLGHSLKNVALLKEGLAIRNRNKMARKDSKDFLDLHNREWTDRISSRGFQTL